MARSVEYDDDAILDDYTKAGAAIWLRVGSCSNEPAPTSLRLDCWVDTGWHVRRRHDLVGNVLMVWLTSEDAISTPPETKWWLPSPTGKRQILFCFNDPFPPIEVVLRTYDTLGAGPYAPIAKATLRHFLA
jgi:hypothetical protein